MSKRRLPKPEEYGRRLAQAKARAEKQRHESARRTEDSFAQVLGRLEEQKAALTAVGEELQALPRDVVAPGDLTKVLRDMAERLTAIQAAIQAIDIDIPAPTVPDSVQVALNDLRELAIRPVEVAAPTIPPPAVTVEPTETIFAGPITLKVTGRDHVGDIDTVRVEPTRH